MRLESVLSMDKENVGISPCVPKSRNPTPSRGFKWTDEDQQVLKNFFNDIPKAPGPYCRKDSNKIYLSSIVRTMSRLHEIYKSRCAALGGRNHFSIKKFTDYVKDNNYSLFKRKKDMCNTCMAHDEGNVDDDVFAAHQKRKEQALSLKARDKAEADNTRRMVVTADTEALLLAPLNDSGLMFFHSKLNLHNFTFYDLLTKDVLNYVWSENNGDIKSSSFVTCYVDFLTKSLEGNPSLKEIILWSDGCTYQNRCNILSSALLSLAVTHNVTIYHKYLEVGHTHMECDSVHSNIETKKRETKINLPSDYINVIQSARKKPTKYGVKYLDFTFFKDFKYVCDIASKHKAVNRSWTSLCRRSSPASIQ